MSWTIKKAEHRRTDAFEWWCWKRLLRIPWTARSNLSILKETNPEYSLEGLMLKLKLQYFCYLMWRSDSLEEILMLGKIEGRRRREQQRMRWLDGIYTVKGYSMINETELDVFLNFPCFLYDPTNVGNLISGSFAFSKPSLYIWKFSIEVLLKPGLENFEHYFTSVWDEYNSAVVWTFFSTALLGTWGEDWPFLVLWPLLYFPNLLAYWVQHSHSIIF